MRKCNPRDEIFGLFLKVWFDSVSSGFDNFGENLAWIKNKFNVWIVGSRSSYLKSTICSWEILMWLEILADIARGEFWCDWKYWQILQLLPWHLVDLVLRNFAKQLWKHCFNEKTFISLKMLREWTKLQMNTLSFFISGPSKASWTCRMSHKA